MFSATTVPLAWASETGNFWLNPVYFTMSANHFTPTWNPLTNTLQSFYFVKHLLTLPFWRFLTNPGVLLNTDNDSTYYGAANQLYLYTSCDANDQFGLSKGHTWLANELICASDSDSPGTTCATASTMATTGTMSAYTAVFGSSGYGAISGGYLYESHGTGGHTFSEDDMEHALKFFSDIFYVLGDAGDMATKSGTVAVAFDDWKTSGSAQCGEYLGDSSFTWYWVGGLNPTCTISYSKPAYSWGDKAYMFTDIPADAISFNLPTSADEIRECYRVMLSGQSNGKMAILDMLDKGEGDMGTIDTYIKEGATTCGDASYMPASLFPAEI